MKKLLSFILILAMLTVAMLSCKKEDFTDAPTSNPSSQTPINPPVENRYTITEDEWLVALTLTNYTATVSRSETYNINGEITSAEISAEMMATTSVVWVKELTENTSEEMYYVFGDGVTYCVREESDGTYEYVSTDPYNYYRNFGTSFACESISYEDLTYNEIARAYLCTFTGEDGATMRYAFYFVDGKLTKVVATSSADYSDGAIRASVEKSLSVTLSNLGTTTLTVPEFDRPGA